MSTGTLMQKLFVLSLAAAISLAAEPANPKPPATGAKVPDFSARDTTGRRHSLNDYRGKKAIVVVFIGTECPISNLYLVTLAEMHKKYAEKGVQILAINSNDEDTFAEVVAHAKERPMPYPVLKDEDHSVADTIGGRRTPEAFLLDARGVIRYRGRIDDQYGYTYRRATPSKTELKDALEEVLADKPVSLAESKVEGCLIYRAKKGTNQPSK
jgi:peroxiredoxin